jgi:cytochrome P450 family 710 subfamily A protein
VKDAADAGAEPPFYHEDRKIAETVMDFLFASQDASTASLVWTITMMAERPEILARVGREETGEGGGRVWLQGGTRHRVWCGA